MRSPTASPVARSLAVGRRGKQLVVELSGDAALTIHLKMTGQLFVVPAEAPEDPYVRLVLELTDGRELRFRDIRKFGRIGLYGRDPSAAISSRRSVARPCSPRSGRSRSTTTSRCGDFRRWLRRRKGRLKPLLTDQSFLAGVGNIYADEALWRARLHPLRSAPSLRPPDERRLYEAIRAVLGEAVERRGSSIDDYTAPDGDGSMQEHARRLPAHRRAVPRAAADRSSGSSSAARSTHFCSWCQRLPAADREGVRRDPARDGGGQVRRGRRWTESAAAKAAPACRRGGHGRCRRDAATRDAVRAKTERTKRAAASRRAKARASMGEGAG